MVFSGVNRTEPFRLMPVSLRQLKDTGFDGVQKVPTVALFDGMFRQGLEEIGMRVDFGVSMIACADELDTFTCSHVFSPQAA